MKILFTFAGGNGHFQPLVPIAHAAVEAGHTVAFAGQAALTSAVAAAGFAMFVTSDSTFAASPQRQPLLKLDLEREDGDLRNGFARNLASQRAAEIVGLGREWQPDLIVCDELDFGAMIAAERLGLPRATVLVIAAGSFVRPAVVADALNEVRTTYGLAPDPDLSMLSRGLVLSPFPPSYRDPAFPLPATAHSIRPLTGGEQPMAALEWPDQPSTTPLVYFSLGTVFNVESGDLFERVLAGLRDQPINVIATVGREIDPRDFGPQPVNIRIERYIPQATILPHCAAVISHAGSGSVIGALAHGLPMVLLPMGADQPSNAARCAELGLAQVLDASETTPADVRAAVSTVLLNPRYRHAADRMRHEIAALPHPATAVPLLEQLVA